nr:MAG TPA: hypothetical protein [Caudoviricetes sp.]
MVTFVVTSYTILLLYREVLLLEIKARRQAESLGF